jgi:hypothetical protein
MPAGESRTILNLLPVATSLTRDVRSAWIGQKVRRTKRKFAALHRQDLPQTSNREEAGPV